MPRPKHAKVWNEDLVRALRARAETALRQGKATHISFQTAATLIENVRGDIYEYNGGLMLAHYPHAKLSATIDTLCRKIIQGTEPIYPPGYVPHSVLHRNNQHHNHETDDTPSNPYLQDPYLKSIKNRGGAFAILIAFHVSQNQVLSKDQLCATGQAFCDDAMRENFHAGQMHGAWAANRTLVKHNLLLAQRGMRGQPSSYTLTDNGKLFLQALLETRPDVQRQIDAARGTTSMTGGAAGARHLPSLPPSTVPTRNPYATAKRRSKTAPTTTTGKGQATTNKFFATDEETLRTWLATAAIGQQKVFTVGKARRRHLHNLCDAIGGLRHESSTSGKSSSQSLYITVISTRQPERASSFPHNDDDPPDASFASSASCSSFVGHSVSPSPATRTRTTLLYTSSPPRTVADSPAKRRLLVPAHAAAAQAAYERYALASPPQVTPGGPSATTTTPLHTRTAKQTSAAADQRSLFADSSSDDDSILQPYGRRQQQRTTSRSSATATVTTAATTTTRQRRPIPPASDVICLDDSSDDDAAAAAVLRKPPPLAEARSQPPSSARHRLFLRDKDSSSSSCSDVDFTTAARKLPASRRPKPTAVAKPPTLPSIPRDTLQANYSKMIICIDDRERNRNATPRMLRMELNRLLTTGPSSLVWSGVPTVQVEERRLASGDFSLLVHTNESNNKEAALPVLIERKRVGDLVQRSCAKDHWYQLQRMQRIASVNVLLLEGDARTASQFMAYGQQQIEDDTSPFRHVIDDEASLFRFFGRAILHDRSGSIRFVQTKDEQSSLRMVGALALMSLVSTQPMLAPAMETVNVTADRTHVRDRLCRAGIPFRLAARIADEVPSAAQLDALYESCVVENRPRLLLAAVHDVCGAVENVAGTSLGWSRAIYAAWCSKDPTSARDRFEQVQGLVQDHALLLEKLHEGLSVEEAVDAVLSSPQLLKDTKKRVVEISLQAEFSKLFPKVDSGQSFYKLNMLEPNKSDTLPSITMQTTDGLFMSPELQIFLLDGKDIVERVKRMLQMDTDCIRATKRVAVEIDSQMKQRGHWNVLIIRGFYSALDQAAKKPDHILETLVVAEMILVELMLTHSIVTIHALRLKNDQELILQQLALACFHFQLLTQEVTSTLSISNKRRC